VKHLLNRLKQLRDEVFALNARYVDIPAAEFASVLGPVSYSVLSAQDDVRGPKPPNPGDWKMEMLWRDNVKPTRLSSKEAS
jgi:hypothetical protein